MTCIIGLKHENKIYMGGDRRISDLVFGDILPDKINPKIIKYNNLLIGFAGKTGLQDYIEIIIKDLAGLPFEDLINKLSNIISLFRDDKYSSYMLVANDIDMNIISTNGDGVKLSSAKDNFLVIGSSGLDIVRGCFYQSKTIDPGKKITQAIEAVNRYYPNLVGGDIDIFTID